MAKAEQGAPGARTVWITGAAGGIGHATVARFAAAGWAVHATDLKLPDARDPGVHWQAVDAASEESIAACVARLEARGGGLDAVVHLAGRAGGGTLAETSLADWRAVLDVNLTSAFLVARAAWPLLRVRRGALVLTASTNALNGGSALSGPAYAAAKAGVANLVRYAAKEWAPDGVRANGIVPGPVDTPMVSRHGAEAVTALARSVPLGRIATPDDVAATVYFLCSPDAAYLTGTLHNVSGGLVLDR